MLISKIVHQVTDFDIKLLRIFKTVVACGSYTAAENILGISKSSISIQMSDLEKRFNLQLCNRGRGGITPTDEGLEVLRLADELLDSIEQFRTEINQISRQLRGEINIGIVDNLITQPEMRIINALHEISRDSEDIRINIQMLPAVDIEQKLIQGHIHIGALPSTTRSPSLNYMPLYDDYLYLYCGKHHPLAQSRKLPTLNQLKRYPAVMIKSSLSPETKKDIHQYVNYKATASNYEAVAFLILTGNYIGFLPDHFAKQWADLALIHRIKIPKVAIRSELALATHKSGKRNLLVKHFIDAIKNTKSESMSYYEE